MNNIQKVLLTGKTRTTSADGRVIAGDHEGKLNIQLSAPGNPGAARHTFDAIAPHHTAEQLFAGAWSACYIAAVGIVPRKSRSRCQPGRRWKWKSISALVAAASSTSRRA